MVDAVASVSFLFHISFVLASNTIPPTFKIIMVTGWVSGGSVEAEGRLLCFIMFSSVAGEPVPQKQGWRYPGGTGPYKMEGLDLGASAGKEHQLARWFIDTSPLSIFQRERGPAAFTGRWTGRIR